MRLMLDMWGVPMRTVSEVYAELEAAGFTELRTDPGPGIPFVRGRRPD
jgi:DNA-binding transcriptional regulator YhcF (GntR family)